MSAARNVIVTGSTSGIGLGIAEAFCAAGMNVMLNGFGDADAIMAAYRWSPEASIPLQAQLAGLRALAGDRDTARAGLDACLARFETERGQMLKIDRAGVLTHRPPTAGTSLSGSARNPAETAPFRPHFAFPPVADPW